MFIVLLDFLFFELAIHILCPQFLLDYLSFFYSLELFIYSVYCLLQLLQMPPLSVGLILDANHVILQRFVSFHIVK